MKGAGTHDENLVRMIMAHCNVSHSELKLPTPNIHRVSSSHRYYLHLHRSVSDYFTWVFGHNKGTLAQIKRYCGIMSTAMPSANMPIISFEI